MDPDSIPTEPPSAVLAPEGVTGLLIAVVILIILSMIFSSSESAFLSINKLRIRFLRSKKDKGAIRVGKLLDRKEQLLNTVLVGNNIVNIAITSLLTSLALQAPWSTTARTWSNTCSFSGSSRRQRQQAKGSPSPGPFERRCVATS